MSIELQIHKDLTTSLSTIADAPPSESVSKVNMDPSRLRISAASACRTFDVTHIKCRQHLSVRIELAVVVFNELL
jgi:hypothetical protein